MTQARLALPGAADADRRLAAFATTVGAKPLVFAALSVLVIAAVTLFTRLAEAQAVGQPTVPVDFTVFWTAARMFLSGDTPALLAATELAGFADGQDQWMPWLYPPGYLMLISPLGMLPYGAAWVGSSALSLVALALALRPFAAVSVPVWLAATLSAGALPALTLGQNSILWLAALVGAMALLRADRPVLAGGLIGLMTLKPQLGPLLAVAMLAGGHWRVVASAALTAVLLAVLPTLVLGTAYWSDLAAMLSRHSARVYALADTAPHMASLFALLLWLGLAKPLALALQWAVFALLIGAVAVTWRKPVALDLKIAVLLAALPLSSPYLWQYEAAALPLAALFLLRAGVLRPTLTHGVLILLLWAAAWPADVAQSLWPNAGLAAHHLVAPLGLIALTLALRAVFSPVSPAPNA